MALLPRRIANVVQLHLLVLLLRAKPQHFRLRPARHESRKLHGLLCLRSLSMHAAQAIAEKFRIHRHCPPSPRRECMGWGWKKCQPARGHAEPALHLRSYDRSHIPLALGSAAAGSASRKDSGANKLSWHNRVCTCGSFVPDVGPTGDCGDGESLLSGCRDGDLVGCGVFLWQSRLVAAHAGGASHAQSFDVGETNPNDRRRAEARVCAG